MMPTFIIFGAPRSGTTSTYHYLRQHPAIVMSFIKETQFFTYLAANSLNKKVVLHVPWPAKTLAEYQALFRVKKGMKAVGEATARYFYVPGVPAQIKAHLPDVQLLCILRNPVQRAYSHYLMHLREGIEDRQLREAIENELTIREDEDIIESRNYYLRAGLYAANLRRYLEYFDRSQISIYFYDDLARSPVGFAQRIYADLGVDPGYRPDTLVRFNRGGIPLFKKDLRVNFLKPAILRMRDLLPQRVNRFIYAIQVQIQNKTLKVPAMPRDLALFLRDLFADDIQELQALVKRDLSSWLEV